MVQKEEEKETSKVQPQTKERFWSKQQTEKKVAGPTSRTTISSLAY